jgi:hypothetical protein
LGPINLSNFIGDPGSEDASEYLDLKELRKYYESTYSYTVNINRFIDYVKGLLLPVFQQAEDLTPARAKLLTGIVLEPNILERAKISFTQPSIENNTYEANPVTSQPTEIMGSSPIQDALFEVPDITEVFGNPSYYDAIYDVSEEFENPLGSLPQYQTTIDTQDFAAFEWQYDNYNAAYELEDYRAAAKLRINARISGSGLYDNFYVVPAVKPYSDFDDIGAREYFTHPLGHVGYIRIDYARLNPSIYNDRGAWSWGEVYNRFDLVIDPLNNVEYFAHNAGAFLSNIEPSYDSAHWRPVPYRPIEVLDVRKAVDISGSISLVSTGSALPGITGYRRNHFRFTRDRRLGITRHQYLGCLQTESTTTDGRPPVETTISAGDQLYVRSTIPPVVPPDDSSGPILEVR